MSNLENSKQEHLENSESVISKKTKLTSERVAKNLESIRTLASNKINKLIEIGHEPKMMCFEGSNYSNLNIKNWKDLMHIFTVNGKNILELLDIQIMFDNDSIIFIIQGEDLDSNILNIKEKTMGILPLTKFKKIYHSLNPDDQIEMSKYIYGGYNNINEKEIGMFNLEYLSEVKGGIIKNEREKYDVPYLKSDNSEDAFKEYAIGTLAHEIAHSIYVEFDVNIIKERESIIKEIGNITKYDESYNEIVNNEITFRRYDESFCESIRIFTTNHKYLKKRFEKAYNFILKHGLSYINIDHIIKNI